ncbi:MAG: glycosyltransferase [Blastocatellia bacterium]
MMRLTILSVAYPFAPVSADAAGGAEQILSLLDEALTRAGHRSLVIASEASQVTGELLALPEVREQIGDGERERTYQAVRGLIARALSESAVDLIHLHGIDCFNYLPPPGAPVLVTLHLPPAWYPPQLFSLSRPQTFLHCVSATQRRACPPDAQLLPEIPNGVAIDRLQLRLSRRGLVFALGRICPEKGFHLALEAAARAGVSMLLAGQVFPYAAHEIYFHEQIVPRLDHRRRFIGPVGFARKRRLLTAARCLLAPSLVAETSSLVAMEAMACGTPVIAFKAGALAEIIEDGVTGFLVRDEIEMADAIAAAGALKSENCREAARTDFSAQRMTEQYLKVYAQLTQPSFRLRSASALHP